MVLLTAGFSPGLVLSVQWSSHYKDPHTAVLDSGPSEPRQLIAEISSGRAGAQVLAGVH